MQNNLKKYLKFRSCIVHLQKLKFKSMAKLPKPVRELPSEGVHPSVCVSIIDLGTQENERFGAKRKLLITFELVNEAKEQPVLLSRQFTFSGSAKSSLVKTLKSWVGLKSTDEFDLDTLLGKPAMLTIEHTETDNGFYANITNITGLPKGLKTKKPRTELTSLYLDETFSKEVFDSLSESLRLKIAASPEYEAVINTAKKPKKK